MTVMFVFAKTAHGCLLGARRHIFWNALRRTASRFHFDCEVARSVRKKKHQTSGGSRIIQKFLRTHQRCCRASTPSYGSRLFVPPPPPAPPPRVPPPPSAPPPPSITIPWESPDPPSWPVIPATDDDLPTGASFIIVVPIALPEMIPTPPPPTSGPLAGDA